MSKKTIYLEDAINALHTEIVKRRISEDVNDDGSLDEFDTEDILRKLPPAQPEWGKPVGDGRPLADNEVVPRLRDIQKQIGGSYAIDRVIEVLEGLSSAQPDEKLEKCRFEYINACRIVTFSTPDTTKKDISDAYAVIKVLQPIFGDVAF